VVNSNKSESCDGFAFLFSESKIPRVTVDLGYSGVTNCLAIEFDYIQDEKDPSVPHISIQENTADIMHSLGWNSTALKEDQLIHFVQIIHKQSRITIFLDGQEILSKPINISVMFENPSNFYLGFTAERILVLTSMRYISYLKLLLITSVLRDTDLEKKVVYLFMNVKMIIIVSSFAGIF